MYVCSYCGLKVNDKLIIDWKMGKVIEGHPITARDRHELHMKYQRMYDPIETTV